MKFDTYYAKVWDCEMENLRSVMDEIQNDENLSEDEVEYLMEQANCRYEP